MEAEPFVEVTENNIPKVLAVLENDWPKHFLLHQMLTVIDEYKKAGTTLRHNLYLHGTYESGVYLNKLVAELPSHKVYFLHVYTKNSDLVPLTEALKKTQVIPWGEQFGFQMGQNKFTNAIVEACTFKGMKCEISSNTMFWYPPEKKLDILPLPDDMYLDFLDGSFADEMDRNWPHKYQHSELVHKEHLEKNFGLGIFRKSDNRLACSALSNYTGGIFTLYSDPEFRGRGLAKILVQHMVKELRQRKRIPFCTAIIGNSPSENTFSKSGFEPFTNADYIFPK